MLSKQNIFEILKARDLFQGVQKPADLPKPHLLKNMQKAINLIISAMQAKKRILIVGDYDADGVNASAVMKIFFEKINYKLDIVIPNRFIDGYGISEKLLQRINAAQKYDLIITVDNGISAFGAVDFCKAHNITLIITDHHTPGDVLPECDCLVNPKQPDDEFPFKDICGCVVAWYLCAGLNIELFERKIIAQKIKMDIFLPFLAIASIADVMPLVSVNRVLVQKGLQVLKNSEFVVFKFCKKRGIPTSRAIDLSFNLIPLLNCAGRMDDAIIALRFLTAKNMHDAQMIYERLNALNSERKVLQKELTQRAKSCLVEKENLIYAVGKDWHSGIVGVICSILAQEYKKSTFVLSGDGEVLRGSARTADADLIATALILQEKENLLLEFGGHKGALGLNIEAKNVEKFMDLFSQNLIFRDDDSAQGDVVGEISADILDMDFLKMVESFEPFGEGNAEPYFYCRDLKVLSAKKIGKEKNHLRYSFETPSGGKLNGVEFFAKDENRARERWCFCVGLDNFSNELILKIR